MFMLLAGGAMVAVSIGVWVLTINLPPYMLRKPPRRYTWY